MSYTPAGVTAIMSRISSFQSGPSRVAEIQSRFATVLQEATGSTAASATSTSSATSTASTASTFTQSSGGAGLVTTPVTAPVTAPVTPPVTPPSTPVADPAGWASRLPASGQAWAGQVEQIATEYGLEPSFLGAVFWTESNYQPQVVSPDGAIGMGQLMPATASWLGVDPWDPVQNMQGSAKYFRNLIDRFDGSIELATASYFAGPGAVKNAGGIPTDRAQTYVNTVLGRRDYLNGTSATAP